MKLRENYSLRNVVNEGKKLSSGVFVANTNESFNWRLGWYIDLGWHTAVSCIPLYICLNFAVFLRTVAYPCVFLYYRVPLNISFSLCCIAVYLLNTAVCSCTLVHPIKLLCLLLFLCIPVFVFEHMYVCRTVSWSVTLTPHTEAFNTPLSPPAPAPSSTAGLSHLSVFLWLGCLQ